MTSIAHILIGIDNIVKRHLKKWFKYPTRGVTDIGICHIYTLKAKQPSQMYLESHAGNIALIRLKGDTAVDKHLDYKPNREAKWKKKSSKAVKCYKIVAQLVENFKVI